MFGRKAQPRCEANVCRTPAQSTEIVTGTGAPMVTAIGVCGQHSQELARGERVRVQVDGMSYNAKRA